jgi:prepilin-type N-terminal cleavage/methylation domain-containing protein
VNEDGFTLVELLAAMVIFFIIMFATLTTLEVFTTQSVLADRRNATQQDTRIVVNQMARQLRNLASPTPGRPQAVDKATPYDLVFQSVDPVGPNAGTNNTNVRRVRYCLNSDQPANGTVWQQVQTWTQTATPAAPSSGACPDPSSGWASTKVVATNVVNRIGGQDRPMWLYNSEVTTDITFVRTTFVFDLKPGSILGETTLSTGVFLRNQNRSPVAAFTATATGNRHVLLNGSISVDPEGEPLTYAWFDGTTQIATGITYDYVAPSAGVRSLSLKVTDPGGLDDTAATQQVNVQ